MGNQQVDFSRVPDRSKNPEATTRTGPTISIDTCYVAYRTQPHGDQGFNNRPDGGYFETAARVDGVRGGRPGSWIVVAQYNGRDLALAGHRGWVSRLRSEGMPLRDMFGNLLDSDGRDVRYS